MLEYEWMELKLIHNRLMLGYCEELFKILRSEVGYAEAFQFSFVFELLENLPSRNYAVFIAEEGIMDEIELRRAA